MPDGPARLVAVVSQNVETACHLRDYFETRGLAVALHGSLSELRAGPPVPSAVVLFPDELPAHELESALEPLVTELSEASWIVVTGDTHRFASRCAKLDEARRSRLVVLPKPAFSWTLFEHVVSGNGTTEPMRSI